MEEPILTLEPKDLLTGVSGSDYSGHGGIFKVATGVSAIRNLGSSSESNIGLLQAGPSGQQGGSGVVVDTPQVAASISIAADRAYLIVFGASGHVYSINDGQSAPSDLGASTQISNFANGCAFFKPKSSSNQHIYYTQNGQIGRVNVNSAPVNRTANSTTGAAGDTWKDNWKTGLQSVATHPMHAFLDFVYFGDDYLIGQIADDGSSDAVATLGVLNVPKTFRITSLSDDGVYLIAALTANKEAAVSSDVLNKIIFWDRSSPSWNREYVVHDEIYCLKRVGAVVYALGSRGIYIVSFSAGVKKVWQIGTGSSVPTYAAHTLSSYNDALVIGLTGGGVAILGKPNPLLPSSYQVPVKNDSGNAVSFVNSEFFPGIFVIGDGSTSLKQYGMNRDTAHTQTGVNAETIYFPLKFPHIIKRIEIVFGFVLATGDDLKVDVASNDGSTYITYGVNGGDVTFTAYGAKKRVALTSNTPVKCEALKLRFTYSGGAPAIQKVLVYGDPVEGSAMV